MKKRLLFVVLVLLVLVISGCVYLNEENVRKSPQIKDNQNLTGGAQKAVVDQKKQIDNKPNTITEESLPIYASAYTSIEEPGLSVEEINKNIQEQGLGLWTAGDNKFTYMPKEEFQKYLGLKIDNWLEIERKREEAATNYKDQLEGVIYEFDWRNQHGQSYVTPIRAQESCGSCWAFGTLAAVEGEANAYYNNPNLDFNLSEQDLVSCYHGSGCSGLYLSQFPDLLNYLINPKVCTEVCFPYTATNENCANKCLDWQTDSFGVISWEDVPFVREEIKNALVTKGPLITAMTVYEDFRSYTGGIYFHTTPIVAGGHVVTIIGYGRTSDGLEYWICKNSWGEDWGENGYFRILMGDSGIDSLGIYAINSPNPTIPEQVICNDNDSDGYCNWGLGNKPTNCPVCDDLVEDCDDSNSSVFEGCGSLNFSHGSLDITSMPNNANVYVKDLETGTYYYRGVTPLTLALSPGARDIKINKAHYYDYETTVNIIENQVTSINVELLEKAELFFPLNYDVLRPGGIIEVIGTVPSHSGFQNYVLEYGVGESLTVWFDTGITLINGGTQPIINSTLGSWDTTLISESNYYTIRLTMFGNGIQFEDSVIIYLDPTLHLNFPFGWPHEISGSQVTIWSPIALSDINNDGYQEIGFGTITVVPAGDNNKDYVIDHMGNILQGWPIQMYSIQGSSLTFSDIDSSTDNEEVIGGMWGNQVFVWHDDGAIVDGWPQNIYSSRASATVNDIDLDGDLEIILPSSEGGGYIYAWHADGTLVDGWPVYIGSPVRRAVSTADINNDGYPEILFGDQDGYFYVLNHNGTLVDGWPQLAHDWIKDSPVIADIDGDGDLEIIISSGFEQQRMIFVWHHDGTLVDGWPQENGLPFVQPSVGDIDKDGDLEILAGGYAGDHPRFFVWHHDGTLVDGWPIDFPPQQGPNQDVDYIYAQPVIGDIDGDTDVEIIVGSYKNKLYAWHHDGTNVIGWPKVIGYSVDSTAAIGDIDNDNLVEVVVAGDDGKVYAWDMEGEYNPSNMEWPMFQHDAQHTGLYTSPILCQNSTLTSCGDIFSPDCDSLGQTVCCGDDDPETFIFKQCHEDIYPAVNCISDSNLNVCCDDSAACTDGVNCFEPTELYDVDNDGHTEDCWWDSWYDPDDNPDHCYIYGGCSEEDILAGPEANCPSETKKYFVQEGESGNNAIFGEYGNGNMYECEGESSDQRCWPYNCDSRTQDCYECCGDDTGEFLISGNGYTRCCNHPNDKIDVNGNCIAQGKPKLATAIEQPLRSAEQNIFNQFISFFRNLF